MMSLPARGLRIALVSVFVTVLGMLGAGTAFAHNTLTGSDPANGAQLAEAPKVITLTFDQAVDSYEPVVTVTGPALTAGGPATRWEGGQITIANNEVKATVNPLGPAGEYIIGFRIISADGHPVSGDVRFTVTEAGTGVPNAVVAVDESTGIPVWVWIGGGVLVVAALVVAGVLTTRRRTE